MTKKHSLATTALSLVFLATFSIAAPAVAKNNHSGGGSNNSNAGHTKANKGNGANASALGALNAAHASDNAMLHAASNSQVGLIRAYKESVYVRFTAEGTLAAANDTLDGFADFTSAYGSQDAFRSAYDAATDDEKIAMADELAYWDAMQSVTDAENALIAARDEEKAALEAASNKDVTEGMITALWDLLEIASN